MRTFLMLTHHGSKVEICHSHGTRAKMQKEAWKFYDLLPMQNSFSGTLFTSESEKLLQLEGTRLINHLVDNCTATLLAFTQTYASGFWMQLNQCHPGTAVWLEAIYDPASTISKSLVNIFFWLLYWILKCHLKSVLRFKWRKAFISPLWARPHLHP